MNAKLEWIEGSALENLRSHAHVTDTLVKEAGTTLTILLATMSGAFAYALKTADYRVGAVALTIYLFALCVMLVTRCMMIGEFPAITNEPRNLNQDGYELDVLRSVELRNIQQRIDQAARRNAITSQWLNRVRIGAICSPLIFAVATCAAALGHFYATAAAAG